MKDRVEIGEFILSQDIKSWWGETEGPEIPADRYGIDHGVAV